MSSTEMTTTYAVTGMTCGHCVDAVTEEIGQVAGVTSVDVDLETGRVVVGSEDTLDASAVRAAVEEAGYELAG